MKQTSFPWQELSNCLQGDLHVDTLHRAIYATDASNYQIKPLAVVCPKNAADVKQTLAFASKYRIPVVGRGGGTSLVGQSIGEGIVLDFTRYMNRILAYDKDERWAWVEPGIVRDVLNDFLKKDGLHFAPDPATSSRATVGGMIANNSSGTRSIVYGKTIDHVMELEAMLADSEIIHCKDVRHQELESVLSGTSRESELYRALFSTIEANRTEIERRFPKVMRRVGGYNLDEFLETDWNLSKLLTGSEGTLAVILRAKIRLEPLPKAQSLCIVHFHDFYECIASVPEILSFQPASVELLDNLLISLSRENLETKRYSHFIQGSPGGVLVVEFFGESQADAAQKAKALQEHFLKRKISYAAPLFVDKKLIEDVFALRKKGLGLLLGVKGNRKPIAFIEDAAVPVQHLCEYIREVFDVCKKHNTPVVAYAHASVGLLHVKPLLDLRDAEDIHRMKLIAQETLQLVLKYRGSWSGEHGDGLARSPYNEAFFGKQLYEAFRFIKSAFDPHFILNPGKIVDAPPPDYHLRYGAAYRDQDFIHRYYYRDEGSFSEAIHLCNGVGECRKLSGGTMCPSFRVTKEEKDSTRGRANVLRLALSGQLDKQDFLSEAVGEALDLCLSCKACKSECPSNVDMAKLKSEILYYRRSRHGWTLMDRMIENQEKIASLCSGWMAPLVNAALKNRWVRIGLEKMIGVDRRRVLPLYNAHEVFQQASRPIEKEYSENTVVLFVDSYIKYHDPSIGLSAIKLLEFLGFEALICNHGCCQRPALSRGLLDTAAKKAERMWQSLEPYLQAGLPIVVCEPSCASALVDDTPDLLEDAKWRNYRSQIFLIEEFLAQQQAIGKITKTIPWPNKPILLHGHCHQKALFGTQALHTLIEHAGARSFREIESGCCGMAGSFGYERRHYDISEKLAHETLVKELSSADDDAIILANGFSCRHQIEHFARRKAHHWVEVLNFPS